MNCLVSLLALIAVAIAFCGCGAATDAPAPPSSPQLGGDPAEAPSAGPTVVPAAEGDYVSFPAVGMKLVRPEGFDDAENFHGFQQAGSGSSVMAVMIPGPYSEVTGGFSADAMATRGMNLTSKEDIEIDGTPGLLVGLTQSAYGTQFAKWIVVFGDERKTRLVTATFPAEAAAELSGKLKAVALSARPDDTPGAGPMPDVGFTIDASEKLKLTTAAGGLGKVLVYSKDGVIPAKSPGDPLFIAAPSLSKVPIEDERQFAVQRLFQTAETKVGSIVSNEPVTIDGLSGFEIAADAEDADSGTPMALYQVILFDEGSYFLMQGLVNADLGPTYLPEFKAMARSLKRK